MKYLTALKRKRAKMGNYRLAPEAKADLERIWTYGLEHWGLEAADKYYTAFFDHFEQACKATEFVSCH